MAHTYMIKTLDYFLEQLDNMENVMNTFSDSVKERQEKIIKALEEFQKETVQLKEQCMTKGDPCNQVEEVTNQAIVAIDQEIDGWNQKKQQNIKGTKFMNKHQKYLVVMVFGAVKSGKSSLGNFIKGDSFVKAPFDNAFKHRPAPILEKEESGRAVGGIEKDETGRQRFAVGYTDTTGDVQFFTMSGLRWMDSPGTGALSKEGDLVNMEAMVKEYIPYTDFCLFLQNSSQPALRDDKKYIRELSREEQKALILITGSDLSDTDLDENDNFITVHVPKSEETRKEQENEVLTQVKEDYSDISTDKYSVFSISTLLAEEAVAEEDDEKFKASHLDMLMNQLGDTFKNRSAELKQERVKKSVNNFVDRLLSGDDEKTGMAQIRDRLDMIHQKRDSYVHTMEERKQRICRRIKDQMFLRIREKAEVWDEEVAKGHMIKSDEAEKEVLSIVQQHISEGINQEVEKIIDNFKGVKQGTFIADLNVGGIEKQTKTIEKEYHKKVVHRRSANGLWENVRSFFGKKYYDVSIETVKKQIHIDMGSNMEDYMERLKPALDKAVENFVAEALANIEKEYFAPQEQYAKQMEAAMERLHQKLESVKF